MHGVIEAVVGRTTTAVKEVAEGLTSVAATGTAAEVVFLSYEARAQASAAGTVIARIAALGPFTTVTMGRIDEEAPSPGISVR